MRRRRRDAGPDGRDRVGVREIAQAAGVSAMTVSRALRGVDGVSEANRAAILRIAQDLNYMPNSAARTLTMTSADLVGISIPTLFNDVFAEIVRAMEEVFFAAGLSTIVNTMGFSPDREHAWAQQLLSWRPRGVVLTGADHDPALCALLRRAGAPTLETWELSPDPIDICVGIDHYEAGALAAAHARAAGYRRPAYVGAPEHLDPRAERRLAALRDAYGDRPVIVGRASGGDFEAGYRGAAEALREGRPDVILFRNDHYAFGGLMACRAQGLATPGDVGVIGFNDLGLNQVLDQKITTVATPRREMGLIGARHLMRRINGVTPPRAVKLAARMVPGDTTRR